MEIGGVAIPQALSANNPTEANERLSKSALYFGVTFLSPFFMLPLLNRIGLKAFKITNKFNSNDSNIIQLSNKHLSGNLKNMRDGIKELANNLKETKQFKAAYLDRFLMMNDNELKLVRKNIIKTKNSVFAADFLMTGVLAGSVPWGVNILTKIFTKRSGFSAEYGMADNSYTNKNAVQFEKNKLKKYLTFIGITSVAAATIPTMVASSLLSKKPQGFLKFIQKHSEKFDYTNGVFMKLLPCFLMDLFGACAGEFLSCRDNYERRDLAVRLSFIMAVFYTADSILNNLGGKLIDSVAKTKLINRAKKGLFGAPIRTLDEIKSLKNIDAKTLNNTKKFAVGMYWSNLILTMLTLGFALPYALNKLLKESVKNDLSNQVQKKKFARMEQTIK